jgi:hypothetical protein
MAVSEPGSADLPWHEDENERKRIGQRAERAFPEEWGCSCGGKFEKIQAPFAPDFKCNKCGQVVDAKGNQDAEKYGWLPVSKIPFEKYSDNTIIAWSPKNKPFIGIRKRDAILHPNGAYPPSHKSKGTWFYLVKIDNFEPLENFGLISLSNELPY